MLPLTTPCVLACVPKTVSILFIESSLRFINFINNVPNILLFIFWYFLNAVSVPANISLIRHCEFCVYDNYKEKSQHPFDDDYPMTWAIFREDAFCGTNIGFTLVDSSVEITVRCSDSDRWRCRSDLSFRVCSCDLRLYIHSKT